MADHDLKPYALARQRFSHACRELGNEDRTTNQCVLEAIVALAPLRAEDMPRSCQLLYENVKQLIGPGLWDSDALGGALASAVKALPLHRANTIIGWMVMARDSLDKHCGVESTIPIESDDVSANARRHCENN